MSVAVAGPPAPRRVAVLADGRQLMARVVVPALLARLADDPRVVPVALLLPDRPGVVRQRLRWRRARRARARQRRRGTGRWDAQLDVRPPDLPRLARRVGARVLRLPAGDPNAPVVVAALEALAVDVLINVGSLARLRPAVLDRVGAAVNLHDGALPRQRGIGVGAWAILTGTDRIAATFHRMTADLDAGPVLVEAPVPVLPADRPADLACRAALVARGLLPALLDAVVAGDPGRPQVGMACLHDRGARRLAAVVDDPASLTEAAWAARLRALGVVRTRVGAIDRDVTGVAACPRPAASTVGAPAPARCGCGLPGWTGPDGRALHVTAVRFRPLRPAADRAPRRGGAVPTPGRD